MSDNRIYELCEEVYELSALCPNKRIYDIALDLVRAYNLPDYYALRVSAVYSTIEW